MIEKYADIRPHISFFVTDNIIRDRRYEPYTNDERIKSGIAF